jgi:hypothetical protein
VTAGHDGPEILLGFTRALRAAGVQVTQDRAHGFLQATAEAERVMLAQDAILVPTRFIIEQLLEIVKAIRAQGTTIILVEQSVNVALTVAETAYFMEKGEIRFQGPTAELLERPDLLRSVFFSSSSRGHEQVPSPAPTPSSHAVGGDEPAALGNGRAHPVLEVRAVTKRPAGDRLEEAFRQFPAAVHLRVELHHAVDERGGIDFREGHVFRLHALDGLVGRLQRAGFRLGRHLVIGLKDLLARLLVEPVPGLGIGHEGEPLRIFVVPDDMWRHLVEAHRFDARRLELPPDGLDILDAAGDRDGKGAHVDSRTGRGTDRGGLHHGRRAQKRGLSTHGLSLSNHSSHRAGSR